MTVKKFAEMFEVEENIAYGLLRFLAEKGLCETGKQPQPPKSKGKPSTLYYVNAEVGQKLATLLQDKLGAVVAPMLPDFLPPEVQMPEQEFVS